jgi:diguanylate cyclase (GGDEF)-like protein/PAS domain S-box-containing protein
MSEAHFRELFEHGFGLVCTHDLAGKILAINPAAAAALGWQPEELIGRNLAEVLADRARPLLPDYLARLAQAGRDTGHMLVRTRDGAERVWAYRNRVMEIAGEPAIVLGHALDITELRQANKALAESERRYRDLFEQSLAMVATHTPDGAILSLNPAAAEILGYEVEELAGRHLAELVPPSQQPRLAHYLAQAAASGNGEGLITFSTSRGEERTLMYRQRLVAEGEPPYVLLNALDVTERLRAEDVLQHQALHDPLTGCANRLLFEDRLAQAVAEAARLSHGKGEPQRVALALLELDDLKAINDRRGHGAGDTVLLEAAARLRRAVRRVDTVARLGGGGFALVLPRAGEPADTERLVQGVVDSLADPFLYEGAELAVGASAGVALFPEHGVTAEELLARADAAMYQAKREGKNRYRFAGGA